MHLWAMGGRQMRLLRVKAVWGVGLRHQGIPAWARGLRSEWLLTTNHIILLLLLLQRKRKPETLTIPGPIPKNSVRIVTSHQFPLGLWPTAYDLLSKTKVPRSSESYTISSPTELRLPLWPTRPLTGTCPSTCAAWKVPSHGIPHGPWKTRATNFLRVTSTHRPWLVPGEPVPMSVIKPSI